MYNYSIVAAKPEHLEGICKEVVRQTEEGIADLCLFMMTLVPEGDPTIDKAGILGENYALFRDRLKEENVEIGILVQATMGHGYKLNKDFAFQHYIGMETGERLYIACPYDEGFRDYLRNSFKTVTALSPKTIMVDDDFRLMYYRPGKGCACPAICRRSAVAQVVR